MENAITDPFVITVAFVCVFIVSFLLGSIPWGVVLSRGIYKKDIRDVGSGNIGTTNAVRAMGKAGGALVFLLDMSKGTVAGLIGFFVGDWLSGGTGTIPFTGPIPVPIGQLCSALAFAGCTWGHIFTPWLKFKGGKGIAVAFGCELVFFGWMGALIQLAVFIVGVAISRMVSFGSICAAAALPFISLLFYFGNWEVVGIVTLLALTVIWAHRSNISRIRHGEERKIGHKK